jgi:hypothetical protein
MQLQPKRHYSKARALDVAMKPQTGRGGRDYGTFETLQMVLIFYMPGYYSQTLGPGIMQSVQGLAAGGTAEGSEFESRGARFFSSPRHSDGVWDPTSLLSNS